MRKWIRICLCVCMVSAVFGCSPKKAEAPKYTAQETLTQYIEAMKKQDGVAMSEFTISGTGDNFAISSADAEAIGFGADMIQSLFNSLFSFTYTMEEQPTDASDKTSFIVSITTYDVKQVLNDAVEANSETFAEIQQNNESEDANKQIADILVSAFQEAPLEYQNSFTFELDLIDNAWKVDDSNVQDFYALLLNTILEE